LREELRQVVAELLVALPLAEKAVGIAEKVVKMM
jgi:hypothetical protein